MGSSVEIKILFNCSTKYLLSEKSITLRKWRWENIISIEQKKRKFSRKKSHIKWKCLSGAYKILEGSLEINSCFRIRKFQKEKWLNMMITSQRHYWTKFTCSNQEYKITHQYSNVMITFSKVTLHQLKITFCVWLYVLDDIWISWSDHLESWLTYEGYIYRIIFPNVWINLKIKSKKLTPIWK